MVVTCAGAPDLLLHGEVGGRAKVGRGVGVAAGVHRAAASAATSVPTTPS